MTLQYDHLSGKRDITNILQTLNPLSSWNDDNKF